MVYFTSDLHIGHRAITKYRPRFSSMEEHDNFMIDRILELSKRDVLYIIGDGIFDGENFDLYIERLRAKKCRIKYVFGNHCTLKLLEHRDLFEIQLPFFSYKNMWVSHCPIHPQEMRNRTKCIHGHIHSGSVELEDEFKIKHEDSRYFNVNIEDNNYQFVDAEIIKKFFKKPAELS